MTAPAQAIGIEKEVLEQLIESAPIAMVTVDRAGAMQYINARLEQMFGYSRAELLGQPVELLMPHRFRAIHTAHRAAYAEHPHVREMGSAMDLVGRRKDGSEMPIEAGLSYVQMDDEMLVMGTITDISRRKQTEEILEQRVEERTREIERRRSVAEGLRYILAVLNSEQTLAKTLEYTVGQACRQLDAAACILYQFKEAGRTVSVRACHGVPTELLQPGETPIGETTEGASVLHRSFLSISDLAALQPTTSSARAQQTALLEHGYRALLAVRLMVKDKLYGGLTLYYARPREFSAEDVQLAVTFGDHAALAIENDRLRAQARRTAVAAERNRIARDLHDSVTQMLFSAHLIAEALPKLQESNPDEGLRRAEELRQLTRGALAEMRTLLLELRPATLANVGLDELLRQLADATAGRARVQVDLHIDGDPSVPAAVKTALFHIAQEALNNVVKHARAANVSIHLYSRPTEVQLAVCDDGVGFDPALVTPEHLGLSIMRERIQEIRGELAIESSPDEGTCIVATWRRTADSIEDDSDG